MLVLTKFAVNKKGFTLIELLVVITIIAILVVVSLVLFGGVQRSARDAQRIADVNTIAKAMETNYSGGYTYLQNAWFAGGRVPVDPFCAPGNPYIPTCTYDTGAPSGARCNLSDTNPVCKYCVGQQPAGSSPPLPGNCNASGSGFARSQTARQQSAGSGFPSGGSQVYWVVCANLEGNGGNADSGRAYCKSNQQ